jgi:hypothetical protein
MSDMKTMYEAEQMSKQKLQAEVDKLKEDYNRKVHDIEEHYAIEEGQVPEGEEYKANGLTSDTHETDSTMSIISLDEVK